MVDTSEPRGEKNIDSLKLIPITVIYSLAATIYTPLP